MWAIYIWKEAVYFERLKMGFFQKTAYLTGFSNLSGINKLISQHTKGQQL
jgi:hypothetical protein